MLVLTRRLDESLIIGDKIIVKVLAVDGDKVKLGIEAPREVSILRNELYQAIQEQNNLASRLVSGPEPESFQKLRELLSNETETNVQKNDVPKVQKGRDPDK